MKYIFFLLFLPIIAFAAWQTEDHSCETKLKVLVSSIYVERQAYDINSVPLLLSEGNKQCYGNSFIHFRFTDPAYYSTLYTWLTQTAYYYQIVSSCPAGQIADANGVCNSSAPCPWAVSPWSPLANQSGYNSTSCNITTVNGMSANGFPQYSSSAAWCSTDQKCYVRPTNCPVGQIYNSSQNKCVYPLGDSDRCTSGYITKNYTLGVAELTKCVTEKICKNNPSIYETFTVSCGKTPNQSTPIDGPSGSSSPTIAPDSSSKPVGGSGGTSGNCFASQSAAKIACTAPNVLSFSCNPSTGVVIDSKCTAPIVAPSTPINSGDSTKSSTTEDIKNLGNTLPSAIKDALSNFFTDGSMSHLEAIRGSLQANTILHAETNDKLDSISASADASLVLQGDANTKLDSVKTSVDGVKDALNTGGTFSGSASPTESELTPDAETESSYDVFKNSITSVQASFDEAKIVFDRGLPIPSLGSGSCPSYEFYGTTVSLSKIGQSISPYSSIFAILIYISSIIASFRMVINFLSRGV